MPRHRFALIAAIVLAAACGKSAEEEGREAVARQQAAEGSSAPAPEVPKPVHMGSDTPTLDKPPEPPRPEPVTPAEIDAARKQAMIDKRDADVIKYCEMTKIDAKTDPQVLLGCALSACRLDDADKARNFAKTLPKELMEQAVKVCTTYNIGVKPAAGGSAAGASGSASP